jgi:molybdate transport system permease protein
VIDPWSALQLSLLVALTATALVAIFGSAIGYFLARKNFPGKNLVDAICTLPLVLPPTVIGFYLLQLLGRHGFVGHIIYDATGWSPLFTWQAAVIASAVVAAPLMVKTSKAAFESVDRSFENVAYTLGKTRLQALFSVTLPLSWKGLVAGVALTFGRALGEFGATLMIAGNIPGKTQTMPLAVYEATQTGDDGLAAMLVLVMTVTSLAVLMFINRMGARW